MSAINDLIDCVESKARLNLISTTSITRTLKNSLLAHQVKLGRRRRITVTLLVFNQAWAPTYYLFLMNASFGKEEYRARGTSLGGSFKDF